MPIEELLKQPTQPSPLQAALGAPLPERPGFAETMQLMFQTGTIIGQLGESVPVWMSSFADEEPGFDAYDPKQYNNADYFARHPSMIEPFKSGAVADIKSSAHFSAFEDRQDRDYEMRQRLGQATGTLQFFAGLAAAAPELVLTGVAGKSLGIAAPKYLTEGTHMARAGKLAVAGGAFNLTYDQAQRAINPSRNVEEGTQALWMFGTGAAFGAAIPLFVAGTNKIGKANTTARVMRLQREAAEMQASPVYQDIVEAAKADAAETVERLKKEPPRPPPAAVTVKDVEAFTPQQLRDALEGLGEDLDALEVQRIASDARAIASNEPLALSSFSALKQRAKDNPGGWQSKEVAAIERLLTPAPVKAVDTADASDWAKEMHTKFVAPARAEAAPFAEEAAKIPGPARPEDIREVVTKSADLRGQSREEFIADTYNKLAERTKLPEGLRLFSEAMDEARNERVPGYKSPFGKSPSPLLKQVHDIADRIMPAPVKAATATATKQPTKPTEIAVKQLTAAPSAPIRWEYRDGKMVPVRDDGPVQGMGAASPEISVGDPSLDAAGADPTRHFTILDTPDTRAQIDEIKALRPDAIFHEHPMQGYYDYIKTLNELQPIDLGPIGNKFAAVMGIIAPGKSVAQSVSIRARQAARLFFDYTRPTQEAGTAPLSFKSEIPAEGIRDIFLGWHDDAARGMHDAYIKGEIEGGRITFGRAVTNYMRQMNDLKRNPGQEPQAPQSVKDAAKALNDYRKKMGRELQDVGLLPDDMDLDAASTEVMRRYLTDRVARNSPDFKAKLIEQQRVNRLRDFDTGEPLVPLERPIVVGAVDHRRKGRGANDRGLSMEERDAIRAMGKPDPTVEGDVATPLDEIKEGAIKDELGDAVYQRYLEEIELWHDGRADETIATILQLNNAHGIAGAYSHPTPTRARLIQMDETRFADYLDDDAWSILHTYHHKVAGRLAARQAIKANYDTWAEPVKKATKKDLAKEGYDPQLIISTVKHDFKTLIDAVGPQHANKPKLQAMFETSRDRTLFHLEGKLAELEGRQLFPDNPSAGVGWQLLRFADRQIGRLASMAFLGKSAIANMGDMTAGSFFRNLTGRQRATMIDTLNFFKNATTQDIETYYVAHIDMIRSIKDVELDDIAGNQLHKPYGSGTIGKVLTAADTAVDYAYDKFGTASGIRRVTSNQSRVFAHRVQQEVIAVSRKMAKARRLVDETGMSEARAMKAVDLHPLDAERMNRLGINGAVAQRLMAQLDKHALDFEGHRVTSDHDGYIAPEMKQWAESDKDLFRRLNFAVNSEVQNLILRPKLGSYPIRDGSRMSHLLRYVNMFQSFTFAWGNQLVPLAARRPGYEVARYIGLTVAAGAIADALYAHLSGKRSIAQSIEGWTTKPFGMLYAAINRSTLLGLLQRPIGALEMLQVGPAKLMGIELQSVYGRRDADFAEIVLGPAYSWMKNLTQGAFQSIRDPGYWERRGARQLWNTLPFHNWWGVEGFNRLAEDMGYDTPVGPEPIPTSFSP